MMKRPKVKLNIRITLAIFIVLFSTLASISFIA